MAFVHGFMVIMRHVPEINFATTRKEVLESLIELSLILFGGNQIICLLFGNRVHNLHLAADGIKRNDATCQFQQVQEFRNRRNFVNLVFDLTLSEHRTIRRGPYLDRRHRRMAAGVVMGTAQLFTSHGHLHRT